MKQTNTFFVLRNRKGNYLSRYKNNGQALAYAAGWSSEVEDALKVPEDYFHGENSEKYLAMAKLFGAELIKVQAEYTFDEQV
ncbi:hypothetical protein [Streptococcus suis]